MKVSAKRIFVAAFNPGLVAAAVFDLGGSSPVAKHLWTGGKRPSWIRGASRDINTIVVDAALPTLVDGCNDLAAARQRMARLGMDAASDIAVAGGCAVAVRREVVGQVFSLALDEDIVADLVTSFAAVELGVFVKNGGSDNGARLSFFDKAAFLTSRNEGRLSSRRFTLPGGADEISATLRMLDVSRIDVLGDGETFAAALAGTGAEEHGGDIEKSYEDLMEHAAQLWAAGNLSVFSTPRRSYFNAALRWLPPAAAALAILCAGTAFPLLDAYMSARGQSRINSTAAAYDKTLQSRARENAPVMSRIEELSRERQARAEELARSQAVAEAVLAVQSAMKTARHLSIESVEASGGGRRLAVAGTTARGTGGELDRFVANLAKSGYKSSSNVSLDDDGFQLRFALEMEDER